MCELSQLYSLEVDFPGTEVASNKMPFQIAS